MGVVASSAVTVVSRWFPDSEIHISPANTGASTPVFRVQVNDKPFWVRLGEKSGERRDGEIAAHRRLFLDGVPVPEVIRYDAELPELDRSIALTSHMPGTPLADLHPDECRPSIAINAGRLLARINRLPVNGFGWAYEASDAGRAVGEHSS